MQVILARDRVKLLQPQPLAVRPGSPPDGDYVPAGTIGAIRTVGETGALVE
jgi:hypothetical protein